MLLYRLLERMIHIGTLKLIDADGKRHIFSGSPGPEATVRRLNFIQSLPGRKIDVHPTPVRVPEVEA